MTCAAHGGFRRRLGRLVGAVAAVCVAAAMTLVGVAPARAAAPATTADRANVAVPRADDDGLRYEAHALYVLDPGAHAVHVTVDIVLTNELPDKVSGNTTVQSYFTSAVVPVLSGAAGFVATRDDGTALAVTTEPTDLPILTLAVIDLNPNLFYGHTQTLRLTYALGSEPPRSDGLTRINDAFTSFTVFVLGDPGITSVRVDLPNGYDVEVIGDDMPSTVEGDRVVYTADAIADPDAWQSSFVVRDDTKLLQSTVSVLGHEVKVQAWPDDQAWADFVDDRVTNGLPVLADLVAQPWPTDLDDLVVTETVSPYLYGYGGWFLPASGLIEIGDDLDPVVVLHELSHMWFNDHLFADRWINEGFAQEYAARTLETLGEPVTAPDPVDPGAPGALQLQTWTTPNLKAEISAAREAFGYNASWFVIRSLAQDIGIDGLAKVIDGAADQIISYRGDGAPEKLDGVADWQRLLDLVDGVGGSDQADALFAAYVVPDADLGLFKERTDGRAAYDALAGAGAGWSPPLGVRIEMSRWHFTRATDLMNTARAILDQRDAIAAAVRPVGLKPPRALEVAYEGGVDLNKVLTAARAGRAAAEALADAHTAEAGHHGFWENIGLKGSGIAGKLRRADAAFNDGMASTATTGARQVQHLVEAADAEGKKRVGLGGGVVVLIFATTFPVRRVVGRRRGRRRADPSVAPEDPPGALWRSADAEPPVARWPSGAQGKDWPASPVEDGSPAPATARGPEDLPRHA